VDYTDNVSTLSEIRRYHRAEGFVCKVCVQCQQNLLAEKHLEGTEAPLHGGGYEEG